MFDHTWEYAVQPLSSFRKHAGYFVPDLRGDSLAFMEGNSLERSRLEQSWTIRYKQQVYRASV
jgi:hypothetical protein